MFGCYNIAMKNFYQVLVNSLIANVVASFLWFALVFWLYLETKSVLVTGVLGGTYMLLVALSSMSFGTIVDHHKKKLVMMVSNIISFGAFLLAGIMFLVCGEAVLLDVSGPLLWLFSGVILAGAVAGNMRNIALSTTVTLLVPAEKRANANGLVGTVSGIGFIVTSVFSGLSIGILGMGWTLGIAIALMAATVLQLILVKIPEKDIVLEPGVKHKKVDIRGSIAAIVAVPGLFGLLIFSTFNNLIGGVYMALMDPYGLTIFSVEMWGIVFGIAGTGFVIGGALVAKFGLGKNPIKTLLYAVLVMGAVGALFTIREWWWVFVVGIWVYMVIVPIAEAAEQTIIQRVVPYKKQGRVFGFAQAFESAAAPITAFMVAPIAEFLIIPYMNSAEGKNSLGWLLGEGEARGIALVFLFSGLIMVLAACMAFMTKSYAKLTEHYQNS